MRSKKNNMIKPKSKLWEWQQKLKDKEAECSKCHRTYYLTVDHIIPINVLYALNLGDASYEWGENFQIICGACNKLKSGNLDITNPQTLPLLKEAIRRCEEQLRRPNNLIDKSNS